jgi:predicted DNA-binding transcriptional regulator AlpA
MSEILTRVAPAVRTNPSKILVSFVELRALGIGFTRVGLAGLIARGEFPAPVRLSRNRIAWRFDDLEKWIASRPVSTPKPDGRLRGAAKEAQASTD